MKAKSLTLLTVLLLALLAAAAQLPARPNVLFIIADDASRHFGEAYGCDWVKTPNIDRLAKQGLVFDNAYTPTSKCAPSRAAILTGRNPWQLEAAANHQPYFPAKFMAFTEALAQAGITALRDKLMAELKRQQDPRALGQGDVFDQYLSPRAISTNQGPKLNSKP